MGLLEDWSAALDVDISIVTPRAWAMTIPDHFGDQGSLSGSSVAYSSVSGDGRSDSSASNSSSSSSHEPSSSSPARIIPANKGKQRDVGNKQVRTAETSGGDDPFASCKLL